MKRLLSRISLLATALVLLTAVVALPARAANQNLTPAAKISFTFDDGLASASTQAAPTLAKYGLTGTDYVITGCVGMTTAPNSCHANTDETYMSWTQVKGLQSTYGWEIGSHTVTHPYLATYDATDGQAAPLTQAQVVSEISQSKAALAAQGINATAFSTPYGDYNNFTLATIAKYYSSHRGFADNGVNNWPYNDYLLQTMQVQGTVTVAQVEAKIDAAIANKQWLVLTMHDIKTNASKNNDDYQWSTANLAAVAAYVQTKVAAGQIANTNISNGLVTGTNVMPNTTFNDGIADGWTTDAASNVTVDANSNGSYPDATKSIKLMPGASTVHLFSPKMSVNATTTYGLKTFLNVQSLTSGEVGFYIDEYDANGNWISGQWKTSEKSSFVEDINMQYKPSSANVSSASLQIYATGNSGITAYVDNAQWFSTTSTATTSFPNGGFTAGISGGWTTDDATGIIADKANHGGPTTPTDSVSLTANATKNTHLFSPKLAVASTSTYNMQSYLNVTALSSGEVGYYIDEYDANSNWISGQYKTGIRSTGAREVNFSYTPSSANVKSASLQVIIVANSGIKAYFDDVSYSIAQ